ncbi:FAD-dependent oxidoreductase [Novosphingobium guangzhouense]|uniref:FAD-dependent oxidoreductase n=2 Tax=Novosphingobium guangzhouense TaxID=1850347 RepID=A0A2K2G171_9SPHN|nr:FAD-dependent oxidoreductase [Novosphingobium guangzhouense]
MMQFDCAIIGAGIVGLAIARALANTGMSVVLIEQEGRIAGGISSRNSGVIHAGIYYPPGSLKARLCVEGRERLYDFCARAGVPHRKVGKLIFAAGPEQSAELDRLSANAAAGGVDDLVRLDAAQIRRMEPALDSRDCLFSPSTGIVDVAALALALLGEAEASGALLALRTPVERIEQAAGIWRVHLAEEEEPVEAAWVVNCAGLSAVALAGTIEALSPPALPVMRYAKGVYFAYSGRHPFNHLVYPLPEPGGLGVHLTLDLDGAIRFGPDVEWIDAVDYQVPADRHAAFATAAQRIWPELDPDRLHPDFAGVRPKISGKGQPNADFVISGPEDHRLPGLVNLFGIESPGLTSSLAIGEHVRGMIVH